MNRHWIIYDGECGFCNKAVMFIALHDTNNRFLFISNISSLGSKYLQDNNLIATSKITIILIENNKFLISGAAIKNICQYININSYLKFIIKYTNLQLLNFAYSLISKSRLLLNGSTCEIPSKEIVSKFIF